MTNDNLNRYFVSVNHSLIQEERGDSSEYEVLLSSDGLTVLQDLLADLASGDEYAFRRALVPYKSADHDDAAEQFDDATIRLFQYLHDHGTDETRLQIEGLNVLEKLENTGYQDEGYGTGSPTNK
ncbi:hypothetical protein NYE24_22985 [Paenibacillus sp. FSL H7-0350]|uniref:hypothetical protein n=1 Tax=Paenibacillus sp. FSL H7-0350 TaxID=2975345 RepID=UPI003158078E